MALWLFIPITEIVAIRIQINTFGFTTNALTLMLLGRIKWYTLPWHNGCLIAFCVFFKIFSALNNKVSNKVV